jgi:hypothetical protein
MTLVLYRWNNAAVPGAYVGRLQYIDPDDWAGYLDRHLTEVDEGLYSEKQLLKLWIESGGDPDDFEERLFQQASLEYLEGITPEEPPGEFAGGTF